MEILPDQNGGYLAALGTAIVLLVGGGYKAFRMIKKDNREDRADTSFDNYRDGLLVRIKELESRTDKLAEERNAAVVMATRLEAEVVALKEKLELFQSQNEILTQNSTQLISRIDILLQAVGSNSEFTRDQILDLTSEIVSKS